MKKLIENVLKKLIVLGSAGSGVAVASTCYRIAPHDITSTNEFEEATQVIAAVPPCKID